MDSLPVSKYHLTCRKAVTGSSFAILLKIGAWRNENEAMIDAVEIAIRGASRAASLTISGGIIKACIVVGRKWMRPVDLGLFYISILFARMPEVHDATPRSGKVQTKFRSGSPRSVHFIIPIRYLYHIYTIRVDQCQGSSESRRVVLLGKYMFLRIR